MNSSTALGIVILILLMMYILAQILNFYGFNISSYATYISFYLFLLLTMLVLPQTVGQ